MRVCAAVTISVPTPANAPGALVKGAVPVEGDRIERRDNAPSLGANAGADASGVLRHFAAGPHIPLVTTPARAAAIARGEQQIRCVGGCVLVYPSQRLTSIESVHPDARGQSHTLTRHVAQSLAQNVDRIEREGVPAAGGFTNVPTAQRVVDTTIADPASQRLIARFLQDSHAAKLALPKREFPAAIGTTTARSGGEAGDPRLLPVTHALVVLVKDATFPEGYRVLTAYPSLK